MSHPVQRTSRSQRKDFLVGENNHRTPIYYNPMAPRDISASSQITSHYTTYLTILLRSHSGYPPPKFPPDILLQNPVDYLLDRMRSDINAPPEPPNSVIQDGRAQMTPCLQRVSCLCARGSSARTRALGDRIRSMVHVCHWGEGVISCCSDVRWERDTETSGRQAFSWRLEGNGWKPVSCAQKGRQRPSE